MQPTGRSGADRTEPSIGAAKERRFVRAPARWPAADAHFVRRPPSIGAFPSLTGRDEIVDLPELPQASVGTPRPHICGSEGLVHLVYDLEHLPNSGLVVHMIDPGTQPTPAALIEFRGVQAISWGLPYDETPSAHPLSRHGLQWYTAQDVRNSSWLRELERRNGVPSTHSRTAFERLRHFVVTFHGSTFECAADEFRVTVYPSGRAAALAECHRRA
jgi:hypothetical protein